MVVAKQKVVTVTTAGTRVAVFAAADVKPAAVMGVVLQPHTVTSAIYVGDSNVSSSAYGLKFTAATQIQNLPLGACSFDPATLYVDAATNGDKLAVLYFEKVGR